MIQSIRSHLVDRTPATWRQNIPLWPRRHQVCVHLGEYFIHVANKPHSFFTENTVMEVSDLALHGLLWKKGRNFTPQGYRDLSMDGGAPIINSS